jgi:hypothetical protein
MTADPAYDIFCTDVNSPTTCYNHDVFVLAGHRGDIVDLRRAILTEHVTQQMAKRQIIASDVHRVLAEPDHVLEVRAGRVVAQGLVGEYLLRMFVAVDRTPEEVVTVYRTSKIDKYRS